MVLKPADKNRLAALCGPYDEHLRLIEEAFEVRLANRGARFRISGSRRGVAETAGLLRRLYEQAGGGKMDREDVLHRLDHARGEVTAGRGTAGIHLRGRRLHPRGAHQEAYVAAMRGYDLNFAIGPAGTGKTWLAVASAVEALETQSVRRLILVRPAVEAGERLGFLPGDLAEKVNPYLRPIYDALYEFLGPDKVVELVQRDVIEVAPLAYMRGRSLNEAFVILDEAQNTTIEQMRMFLTRFGFATRAVVTGDVTQTDLPPRTRSGLKHALAVLRGVEGISMTYFTPEDVVRNPLVARIVEAYERHERPE
ncbi:MAG: PhoH family protein [Gammaproteobacteria bacterium]|nr:PhoH family protein [Gammaproteobacteria bacterium]